MGAFSAFKDKRTSRKKRELPSVNSHYLKLARISAVIRYACIIFAVAFAVYSLAFHASEISMENFRYMLKFINPSEEEQRETGSLLAFEGSEGNRGLIFKGDLAVLNENGLTIIGWDGETILREAFSLDHPKVENNGMHLFCYDLGGRELRIFNSYSRISTLPFDYPIYWLAASENGGFVAATSAKGYRSAVYVYDKEFRVIYSQLLGDKYVDFVDISPKGNEFISAAHYSEEGNIVTLLSKMSTASEDAVFEEKFVGEIPLGVYYTDNGFCLMTSDKLRSFDNENNLIGEISFANKSLLSGRVEGDRILLNYALEGLSGGTKTVIYNLNTEEIFSHDFPYAISDSVITEDSYYVLSPGVFSVFNLESEESQSYSVPTSYTSLLKGDDNIILFAENQAEVFNSNAFELKEEN